MISKLYLNFFSSSPKILYRCSFVNLGSSQCSHVAFGCHVFLVSFAFLLFIYFFLIFDDWHFKRSDQLSWRMFHNLDFSDSFLMFTFGLKKFFCKNTAWVILFPVASYQKAQKISLSHYWCKVWSLGLSVFHQISPF